MEFVSSFLLVLPTRLGARGGGEKFMYSSSIYGFSKSTNKIADVQHAIPPAGKRLDVQLKVPVIPYQKTMYTAR